MKIPAIEQEFLNKLFSSNVVPHIQLIRNEDYADKYTEEELSEITRIIGTKYTVLGLDIYQYSLYKPEKQAFIPHLFDMIYEETWHLIRQNFYFIFQKYGKLGEYNENRLKPIDFFVPTGDGGFQIFETPIHAIVFLLTFAVVLRFYNSDLFMRRIHAKIGNIDMRFALSLDNIYAYRSNFFGPAIINNSRLLARDKLNRFLIEGNVFEWFLDRIAGIENMMVIGLNDLLKIDEFSTYKIEAMNDEHNALIHKDQDIMHREGITSLDIQKIGEIQQKKNFLNVYNLHLQAVIEYQNICGFGKIVSVSIGNLNTTGID